MTPSKNNDGRAQRLERLRAAMAAKKIPALVVSQDANRLYLSGFTGEGVLVITPDKAILLTDFRYVEQAIQQAPDFTLVQFQKMTETLEGILGDEGIRKAGFEAAQVTVQQLLDWQEKISGVAWEPTRGLVEELRRVKDAGEVEAIRQALAISEAALAETAPNLKPGMTEIEAATLLEFGMRRRGGIKPSFETIVASGHRGALPHGTAAEKTLAKGEFITMDFGTVYRNYCSDLTRTVFLGTPDQKQREVYRLVLEAQEKAIAAVRPGMTGAELDGVARRHLEEAGYGEYFGHGLGHGVGLEIHEAPRCGPNSQDILEPGMIITIEPGIYIPGWGGVRIEDMMVVTENGGEVITKAPKELLTL